MTAKIKMVTVHFTKENEFKTVTVEDATADKVNKVLKKNGYCYGFTEIEPTENLEAWKPNSYDYAEIYVR